MNGYSHTRAEANPSPRPQKSAHSTVSPVPTPDSSTGTSPKPISRDVDGLQVTLLARPTTSPPAPARSARWSHRTLGDHVGRQARVQEQPYDALHVEGQAHDTPGRPPAVLGGQSIAPP